jgi:hypothetical protein
MSMCFADIPGMAKYIKELLKRQEAERKERDKYILERAEYNRDTLRNDKGPKFTVIPLIKKDQG